MATSTLGPFSTAAAAASNPVRACASHPGGVSCDLGRRPDRDELVDAVGCLAGGERQGQHPEIVSFACERVEVGGGACMVVDAVPHGLGHLGDRLGFMAHPDDVGVGGDVATQWFEHVELGLGGAGGVPDRGAHAGVDRQIEQAT